MCDTVYGSEDVHLFLRCANKLFRYFFILKRDALMHCGN